MNDAVKYFNQDISRDPSEIRTKWILQQLRKRPHGADELVRLAGSNRLGYAQSTYSKDLTGLVKRNLICPPFIKGGNYSINGAYAFAWMSARGILDD